MHSKRFVLALFMILFSINLSAAAVTYDFSGGRFGDNLLAYCHAKWISFKYGIPLLYKPFGLSEQLALHNLEQHMNHNNTMKEITLTNDLNIKINQNLIYVVPYFSEVEYEHSTNPNWIFFKVDWDDPEFKKQLQAAIRPVNMKKDNFKFQKDSTSVAVHIRTGGGYDDSPTINLFPLKFPHISFYIDQIKKISELKKHAKLYVYVFTDDLKPDLLVSKIKNGLQGHKNIDLDFRKQNNAFNKNIIEDFFFMTEFDCLIRGQSNYSIIAAKIANYKIEISPRDFYRDNEKIFINKVDICIK